MEDRYDLVIIGAGSGGLTAADLASRLGVRVAVVERDRIGGDCTWTGCVPSKALLKAAQVAHDVRTADQYGILSTKPATDMAKVRDFIAAAMHQVHQAETPDALRQKNIDVLFGAARFVDSRSIAIGDRLVRAKRFLITTGARPTVPSVDGLNGVPFMTYDTIFHSDRLPRSLIVLGGGPGGTEVAQAYQRLGSQVTVVAPSLLPKEDADARRLIERVLQREGVRFLSGRASRVERSGDEIIVGARSEAARGEMLLVAAGREPTVEGLDLDKAGVESSKAGIPVDSKLRTNVRHIYAAGDVIGGEQFTHLAAWQAFHAARHALIPAGGTGSTALVPRVTFTDPEVAHFGPSLAQARSRFGDDIEVRFMDARALDRAVCEDDREGFVKIIATKAGRVIAATIVARHAGEIIGELMVAINRRMKVADLANTIHAYPTYATGIQQMAADLAIDKSLSGFTGRIARRVAKALP